jgi:hypothetical protein
MNPTADYPKFPLTFLIHVVGTALSIAALYLLGLTVTDLCSSYLKFSGALIVFFGCDELAVSGWRSWRQCRSRRAAAVS